MVELEAQAYAGAIKHLVLRDIAWNSFAKIAKLEEIPAGHRAHVVKTVLAWTDLTYEREVELGTDLDPLAKKSTTSEEEIAQQKFYHLLKDCTKTWPQVIPCIDFHGWAADSVKASTDSILLYERARPLDKSYKPGIVWVKRDCQKLELSTTMLQAVAEFTTRKHTPWQHVEQQVQLGAAHIFESQFHLDSLLLLCVVDKQVRFVHIDHGGCRFSETLDISQDEQHAQFFAQGLYNMDLNPARQFGTSTAVMDVNDNKWSIKHTHAESGDQTFDFDVPELGELQWAASDGLLSKKTLLLGKQFSVVKSLRWIKQKVMDMGDCVLKMQFTEDLRLVTNTSCGPRQVNSENDIYRIQNELKLRSSVTSLAQATGPAASVVLPDYTRITAKPVSTEVKRFAPDKIEESNYERGKKVARVSAEHSTARVRTVPEPDSKNDKVRLGVSIKSVVANQLQGRQRPTQHIDETAPTRSQYALLVERTTLENFMAKNIDMSGKQDSRSQEGIFCATVSALLFNLGWLVSYFENLVKLGVQHTDYSFRNIHMKRLWEYKTSRWCLEGLAADWNVFRLHKSLSTQAKDLWITAPFVSWAIARRMRTDDQRYFDRGFIYDCDSNFQGAVYIYHRFMQAIYPRAEPMWLKAWTGEEKVTHLLETLYTTSDAFEAMLTEGYSSQKGQKHYTWAENEDARLLIGLLKKMHQILIGDAKAYADNKETDEAKRFEAFESYRKKHEVEIAYNLIKSYDLFLIGLEDFGERQGTRQLVTCLLDDVSLRKENNIANSEVTMGFLRLANNDSVEGFDQ